MEIVLRTGEQRSTLGRHYRAAFADAVELYVVSAYLGSAVNSLLCRIPRCARRRARVSPHSGFVEGLATSGGFVRVSLSFTT